jgi:gluconolactonase
MLVWNRIDMKNFPSHLDVRDDRFLQLVHPVARLSKIAEGFTWTEGPVWIGDHNCLLFSDIPSQRIMRWSHSEGASIFRSGSDFNNGNSRDRQGRLVGCRHGTRDVVRTESNGTLTVLASSYEGKRLNSPNDLVVSSDGAVWFTDPSYGILSNFEGYQAEPEQDACNVFRIDLQTGTCTAVVSDFVQPNGLAFSLDETRLFIAESGASHDPNVPAVIRQFDVDGATLTDRGTFATIDCGIPDGLRIDTMGNLWTSAGDGVHCFASDGTFLGKILVPETVSNLCFGGQDGHTLFITATTSVFQMFVNTQGAEPWTRPTA